MRRAGHNYGGGSEERGEGKMDTPREERREVLTPAKRADMPAKDFAGGGPKGAKGFPIGDKVHARMAISGATRSERAGNISAGTEARIKAEARAKLAK